MKLHITNKMTIAELQMQFNKEFPYLKIEFFDVPYTFRDRISQTHVYASHRKLESCKKNTREGIIEITGNDTVDKLEKTFWEEYGLNAEVFRKSGNLWIETSLSNSWTLRLQNEEGKMFSEGMYKGKNKNNHN